jgi:hypothetical protein|tara:strand:+ start:3640 stop:3798 length:159 start_codon:yes stop_codon:yes gene_type:complete
LNYYTDKSRCAQRTLQDTSYQFKDITDKPAMQQLLATMAEKKTKMREALGLH